MAIGEVERGDGIERESVRSVVIESCFERLARSIAMRFALGSLASCSWVRRGHVRGFLEDSLTDILLFGLGAFPGMCCLSRGSRALPCLRRC